MLAEIEYWTVGRDAITEIMLDAGNAKLNSDTLVTTISVPRTARPFVETVSKLMLKFVIMAIKSAAQWTVKSRKGTTAMESISMENQFVIQLVETDLK